MRTTVDIPDPIYRELKSQAALEGKSVKEFDFAERGGHIEDPGGPVDW